MTGRVVSDPKEPTDGPRVVAPRGIAILRGHACGCAVAFGPEGLLGTRILAPIGGPIDVEAAADLEAAVLARRPDVGPLHLASPAGHTSHDVATIARHLAHGDADLRAVRIDWRGASAFRVRVSELARAIGPGEVRTYGELARELAGSARSVGRAMATNPFPIVVPCHRVVAASGAPGGFSAPGGLRTKDALLRLEGGRLAPEPAQLSLY